jgi:hypothetical protein
MLIYNVTVKVDWGIHDEWVKWMKNEHLPEMADTGCFTNSQLLRLLDTDEKDGATYAAQYFAETRSDYDRYIADHAAGIRKKYVEKWSDRVISFRSLMQVVQ